MEGFFSALSQHTFLQTAVAAALLASVGCGVMGTYVVVKRIAFIAGGIAHSVLGGMGAAVYYGLDPLHGALLAAIAAALVIGWVRLNWRTQEDTLIGALWAIGMAELTLRKIHRHLDFQAGSQVKISRRSVRAAVLACRFSVGNDYLLRLLFELSAIGLPSMPRGLGSVETRP